MCVTIAPIVQRPILVRALWQVDQTASESCPEGTAEGLFILAVVPNYFLELTVEFP